MIFMFYVKEDPPIDEHQQQNCVQNVHTRLAAFVVTRAYNLCKEQTMRTRLASLT